MRKLLLSTLAIAVSGFAFVAPSHTLNVPSKKFIERGFKHCTGRCDRQNIKCAVRSEVKWCKKYCGHKFKIFEFCKRPAIVKPITKAPKTPVPRKMIAPVKVSKEIKTGINGKLGIKIPVPREMIAPVKVSNEMKTVINGKLAIILRQPEVLEWPKNNLKGYSPGSPSKMHLQHWAAYLSAKHSKTLFRSTNKALDANIKKLNSKQKKEILLELLMDMFEIE